MPRRTLFAETTCHAGFTLIELMVVIALVALLAGTAAVVVRAPVAHAQRELFISQLKFLDSSARLRASSGDTSQLRIDLQTQTCRVIGEQEQDVMPVVNALDKYRMSQILRSDGMTDGFEAIEFDRYGTSVSYAISILSESGTESWLVFLGLSGQTYEFTEEAQVRAIIQP